jgi:hypothetical protein
MSSGKSIFSDIESFDEETARAMGRAFDEICRELHDTGQPEIVRDVIATKIVEAARSGERDSDRLCEVVLASFGLKRRTGLT